MEHRLVQGLAKRVGGAPVKKQDHGPYNLDGKSKKKHRADQVVDVLPGVWEKTSCMAMRCWKTTFLPMT
jgi:hypothetical protein